MSPTISSRTPDGQPNVCPVCKAEVCLEPSTPFGDAPCPNCGTLLWFIGMPNQRLLFARRSTSGQRESVIRYLAEQLGVDSTVLEADASLLSKLQTDSLDVVELVMKLEEHFDL